MYNGPPASPAAPACLSPFIFLHKANSHPLINAAASLGTFSSLYLFFCPEMPEASSCSAQNSADLSAALSPGSSYLISFCTSLAPWLSAFLLSRFLSQAHCVADCVFPSENLVSTFFLVWTPSHCLFLPPPPKHSMVGEVGAGLGNGKGYCLVISLLWRSPLKIWKTVLSQFILPSPSQDKVSPAAFSDFTQSKGSDSLHGGFCVVGFFLFCSFYVLLLFCPLQI